jgi:hypothetical protein
VLLYVAATEVIKLQFYGAKSERSRSAPRSKL